MKQTLKTLIRNVKSIKGNSLAEFATTTALMATLAATAAPKLSEMSEGAKAEKSRNEIDKIIKQGGQFYQDTADIEGRGRFPGQDKYDKAVGTGDETKILNDLIGDVITDTETGGLIADPNCNNCTGEYHTYDDANQGADWVSVFGTTNADAPVPQSDATGQAVNLASDDQAGDCDDCPGVTTGDRKNPGIHTDENGEWVTKSGSDEWLGLFGDTPLTSQYQDGHFVYQVVPGGKTGNDSYPPVLYVADIENASHFNNVLEP
jgi:uncharacterized protein (DUF2147 family)